MSKRDLVTSSGIKINNLNLPLYAGSSVIDLENSKHNLLDFKKIMDREKIYFALTAGTALGAVRDKNFIEHDEDIDLALFSRDKQRVINILPELQKIGFQVVRYNRRHVISIMRNNDYMDLCFFEKINEEEYDCDGCMILSKFMENTKEYEFLGEYFQIPQDYQGYLRCEYGENWEIPRYDFNFNMPKWKKILKVAKEKLKLLMPDSIFLYFSEKSAQKHRAYYRNLFEFYNNSNN